MESIRYVSLDLLAIFLTIGVSITLLIFLLILWKLTEMKRYIVNCYSLQTKKLLKTYSFNSTSQVDKFIDKFKGKYKIVVRETLEIF